MSKQQWTVSIDRSDLSEKGLQLVESFEHENYKKNGQDRIDFEESDFFSFAEAAAAAGVKLPTDGGDSWCKWV